MASTYTTKRRLVAAAMRWHKKIDAGRDARDEEIELIKRCDEHHVAELAWRRWSDRYTRAEKRDGER